MWRRGHVACALPLLWGALLSLGCHQSTLLQRDPFVRADNASLKAVYEIDWWAKLAPPRLWEYAPRELASPAIDEANEQVIVATRDGQIRAVSASDGSVRWAFKASGVFNAGPLVADGRAYVAGGNGVLYALDAKTGALQWKYEAGEELGTTPVLAMGLVLVASVADTLFAVDAQSGQWKWQHRRDTPSGFTIRGAAAPTVSQGVVYAGFADGFVVALELTDGSRKWERSLSTPGAKFIDVDTAPVLDPATGRLYAASYESGVFALNPETGEVLWKVSRPGITHLLPSGEVIFLTGASHVAAVSSKDGAPLWTYELGERFALAPVRANGFLAVPVNNGLVFLDPLTGRPATTLDTGRGISATPAVSASRMYVLSNLGSLFALDLVRTEG